jgi:hypothetical protein
MKFEDREIYWWRWLKTFLDLLPRVNVLDFFVGPVAFIDKIQWGADGDDLKVVRTEEPESSLFEPGSLFRLDGKQAGVGAEY